MSGNSAGCGKDPEKFTDDRPSFRPPFPPPPFPKITLSRLSEIYSRSWVKIQKFPRIVGGFPANFDVKAFYANELLISDFGFVYKYI